MALAFRLRAAGDADGSAQLLRLQRLEALVLAEPQELLELVGDALTLVDRALPRDIPLLCLNAHHDVLISHAARAGGCHLTSRRLLLLSAAAEISPAAVVQDFFAQAAKLFFWQTPHRAWAVAK